MNRCAPDDIVFLVIVAGRKQKSDLLKHLLALSGNGMHLHDTLQLAQFIGGTQLKHQLSFLNGLRPMLQQLPIVLWKDLKARQNALGNLLTLMAELTQQEHNLARGNPA